MPARSRRCCCPRTAGIFVPSKAASYWKRCRGKRTGRRLEPDRRTECSESGASAFPGRMPQLSRTRPPRTKSSRTAAAVGRTLGRSARRALLQRCRVPGETASLEITQSRARRQTLSYPLRISAEKALRRPSTLQSSHSIGSVKLPRTFAVRPGKDAAAFPRCAPTTPEPLPPAGRRAAPETEFPDRIPTVQFSAMEKYVAPRLAEKL